MPEAVKQEPIRYQPNGTPVYAENAQGRPVCGHPTQQEGHLCQNRKVFPNGRCKKHGSELYIIPFNELCEIEDRRSSIMARLPPNLREAFTRSMDDPAQLSLGLELGLIDTNLARLMDMLKDVPDGTSWRDLRGIVNDLGAALESEDPDLIEPVFTDLQKRIAAGNVEDRIWDEIKLNNLQRAKLVEAETRRLAMAKGVATVQEAENMIVTIFRVMGTYIDTDRMKRIRTDFLRQLSGETPSTDITETGDIVEAPR